MEGELRAQCAKLQVERDHVTARAAAVEKRLSAMMPMLRQQADEIVRLKKQLRCHGGATHCTGADCNALEWCWVDYGSPLLVLVLVLPWCY